MKKIISFCLLFSTLTISLQAQETTATQAPSFSPSFAAKWNPGSLYFGKVSLFGEYNFKKKRSITFGIGIPVETTHSFDLDSSRDISLKTFSVMGGYRMYLGKKTMSGLYLEPYVKYMKNDASTIVNANVGLTPQSFNVTSNYSAFGAGAQLGVQFSIAKIVEIDLFVLGPEANMANHEMKGAEINPSSVPWTPGEKQDVENNLYDTVKDVPFIGNKIKFTADANAHSVTSDYSGFLPGIRFGGSIGVRF
jgi:hypothetical protein